MVPGAFVWDLTWSLVRLYEILRGTLVRLYGILRGPSCVCMGSYVVPSAFVWDITWSLVRLYEILRGPWCVCM